MRQFAADDDAHPGAGAGPAAQVQQVRDLDDIGVFPQPTVAVVRGLPGPGGGEPDRVPDRFGDREANREVQVLLGQCGDQGVGVARAVSSDQDLLAAPPVRDLGKGLLEDGQVIGGVLLPALPGRSSIANASLVLSNHAPRG